MSKQFQSLIRIQVDFNCRAAVTNSSSVVSIPNKDSSWFQPFSVSSSLEGTIVSIPNKDSSWFQQVLDSDQLLAARFNP